VAVAYNGSPGKTGEQHNDGCGSMHPEEIQRVVEISGATLALVTTAMLIAFFFADEDGEIVRWR